MVSTRSALHNRHAWLPESLWLDPRVRRLTGAAKDVVVYLHICRNRKTGQIDPAVRTMAKQLCLADSTIWRALEELRAAGIVETANRGRRDSLLYSFPSVCPHADTTVCSHADTQPARVSSFAGRECLHSGQNASVPTQTEHFRNTAKQNTTTRSSPDGGGEIAAAQGSEEPIPDTDRSPTYQALVQAEIREPHLSRLAADPLITPEMVRDAAHGYGEERVGGGVIIPELKAKARAAKLKHHQSEVKTAGRRRAERYAEIYREASDDQKNLIAGRWPGTLEDFAAADPIPGEQLFDLDPAEALLKILDAVHGPISA